MRDFEALTARPRRGDNESGDWTFVERDGGHRQVRLVVSAIRDYAGLIDGFLGVAIDRSQLQAMEQALRLSEAQFRTAFDTAPQGMALVSLEGRFIEVNRSLCTMLEFEREALLATEFQALTHADDLASDLDLVGRLIRDEIPQYQLTKRYFTHGGRMLWGSLSVSLVRDDKRRPLYFVSQIQDITEQRHRPDSIGKYRWVGGAQLYQRAHGDRAGGGVQARFVADRRDGFIEPVQGEAAPGDTQQDTVIPVHATLAAPNATAKDYPRIYILEDDEALGRQLCQILESFHYAATLFVDGQVLQQACRAQCPDALILDLHFADDAAAEGLAIGETIQCETRLPLPIFATEESQRFDVQLRAVRAGVLGVLARPLDPIRLAEMLEVHLRGHRAAPMRVLMVDGRSPPGRALTPRKPTLLRS